MNEKTTADLAFEEYLSSAGVSGFDYEKSLPETRRVPDYQVVLDSRLHLFEVKGFAPEVPERGFGVFDPYPPIRKKIVKAVEKFRDLEAYPCTLVLYHDGPGLILLEPYIIMGAMLGEVAFSIPLKPDGSGLDSDMVSSVFTTGGKMLNYSRARVGQGPPRNTTINAIIVVEHFAFGRRRFSWHVAELQKTLGRELTGAELWTEVECSQGTERDVTLSTVRCRVHENPYARLPLSRRLFTGPYDERYGDNGEGHIVRVFVGSEAEKFDD